MAVGTMVRWLELWMNYVKPHPSFLIAGLVMQPLTVNKSYVAILEVRCKKMTLYFSHKRASGEQILTKEQLIANFTLWIPGNILLLSCTPPKAFLGQWTEENSYPGIRNPFANFALTTELLILTSTLGNIWIQSHYGMKRISCSFRLLRGWSYCWTGMNSNTLGSG